MRVVNKATAYTGTADSRCPHPRKHFNETTQPNRSRGVSQLFHPTIFIALLTVQAGQRWFHQATEAWIRSWWSFSNPSNLSWISLWNMVFVLAKLGQSIQTALWSNSCMAFRDCEDYQAFSELTRNSKIGHTLRKNGNAATASNRRYWLRTNNMSRTRKRNNSNRQN